MQKTHVFVLQNAHSLTIFHPMQVQLLHRLHAVQHDGINTNPNVSNQFAQSTILQYFRTTKAEAPHQCCLMHLQDRMNVKQ